MARTNKYTSVNFNDFYEKKLKPTKPSSAPSPSPSSSSSSSTTITTTANHLQKTHLSATRSHGRMLVLTRPTPKPIPIPIPIPQPSPPPQPPTQSSESDQNRFEQDSISLRPLGRTGSGLSLPSSSPSPVLTQERDKEVLPGLTSPKPNRFVPPHLRPGFVGREERLGPEVQKQTGFRPREFGNRQGHYGSPGRYGEDGRPKSGGGNERMRRGGGGGGESDLVEMSRPSSGGNRPSSSGWSSCASATFNCVSNNPITLEDNCPIEWLQL